MFTESAELYDLIYMQFKDYAEESGRIATLLKAVHPEARNVLDVACGTGEHARLLASQHGYEVDGVDVEPAFVRIAQAKNPRGTFSHGNMVRFDLGRRYDAVLCLFSSIGYVRTLDNVRHTLNTFRRHLGPGGVVLVEPWVGPEEWRPGSVHMRTVETDAMKVCRMSHSDVRNRISVLDFHYLIGSVDGLDHRREVHELGLFTTGELESCFADVGLGLIEYDPVGLTGRGLFTARASS